MNPADLHTVSSDSDVAALSDLEQDDGDEEGKFFLKLKIRGIKKDKLLGYSRSLLKLCKRIKNCKSFNQLQRG